jgi:hypothetical protein
MDFTLLKHGRYLEERSVINSPKFEKLNLVPGESALASMGVKSIIDAVWNVTVVDVMVDGVEAMRSILMMRQL